MDNDLRNTILESLEYELDMIHDKCKGGHKLYNPNQKSNTLINSILDYLMGIVFLLFSPVLPFLNLANRFRVHENYNSNVLNFITSPNITSSGDENVLGFIKSGNQYNFKIKYYIDYLKLIYRIMLKIGFKAWYYQCVIKLPEIIMVLDFISATNIKTVKISNHYDRWAYLFSILCVENNMKLVVYQHGIVFNPENEGWKPKKKLPRVDELFCYDKKSANYFIEHIYVDVDSVNYFKNKVHYKDVDSVEVNFLLIGSGFLECVKKEIHISNYIAKAYPNVNIFIKPHPKFNFSYSRLDVSTGAKTINFNIKPDVMVHFGSTLASDIKLEHNNVIDLNVASLGLEQSLLIIDKVMQNIK
ncbi:MAG: hypothetical protein HRT55_11795 [Colwellia sp.]|uniref:hypothetical protein n=1 Tax=Alteromonadales TaxID=135622 RepID=UPI001D3E37D1|nr:MULTISPECIES: hypothetical protein [Alteromonadales]NQZ26989.1 hypothetical protein [Colwellia sp.]NRA78646.1 hypothetical protein [Pseudoalteromonas sp.]